MYRVKGKSKTAVLCTDFATIEQALEGFHNAVTFGDYDWVQIGYGSFGVSRTIRRWDRKVHPEPSRVKHTYVVQGYNASTRTRLRAYPYKTEIAAIRNAKLEAKCAKPDIEFVIYKAIKIVRRDDPPVIVEDVE